MEPIFAPRYALLSLCLEAFVINRISFRTFALLVNSSGMLNGWREVVLPTYPCELQFIKYTLKPKTLKQ